MGLLPRPLKSHRQDHIDDCGRACAQMVIGYVQMGAGGGAQAPIQQDVLEKSETNAEPNWATDPLELAALINTHVSPFIPERWKLASYSSLFAASPQNPPPGPEAATLALFGDVKRTIDHGFPAVVATGQADHWIVITGYENDASGELLALYQADPLAVAAIGATFPHTHTDVCSVLGDIRPVDILPDDYFIVNALPFVGQAVGILTHDTLSQREILALKLAGRQRLWNERWIVVPPPPPLMLPSRWPLGPWPWFVPREVSLRVAAHRWRPELHRLFSMLVHVDRGVLDVLDPESARVRFVRYERDARPPFVLVGVPIDQEAAMLLVLNQAGQIQLIRPNASRILVDALEADDPLTAEDLFCVSRFGQLQPFVRRRDDDGRVVFDRLGDGFRWVPPSGREV